MTNITTIIKYEFLNILRNRWLFFYILIVALTIFTFQKISGNYQKTIFSLSSISVILVPLITSLFTTIYWYYSERFTQLMLTQPIPRHILFCTRILALTISLSSCFGFGVLFGTALIGEISFNVFTVITINTFLTFIFVALSLLISIKINDRMRGVGLVFGIWLYFTLVHDGFILLFLAALHNYPVDLHGGLLGALSPIGLSRVVLLMHNEGALLLGHTGALVREILTSWKGYFIAFVIFCTWTFCSFYFGYQIFKRKDF